MTSTDTIRTVIEIVPGFNVADWECGRTVVCCDWGDNEKIGQIWNIEKVPPLFLDALAAAGAREVKRIARERKQPWLWANMVTELRRQGLDKDDTDFWLEAIAEFVNRNPNV